LCYWQFRKEDLKDIYGTWKETKPSSFGLRNVEVSNWEMCGRPFCNFSDYKYSINNRLKGL